MSYNSTEILYFTEYTFNDTGDSAPHFGLVIVPPRLTEFKESILCAVITSRKPRNNFAVQTLNENTYSCFNRLSYARLRDLDYVHNGGLDKTKKQPVGALLKEDAKISFKKLKSVLFSPNPPVDKYLRAAILREWKKALSS